MNGYLLDTHSFLWSINQSEKLSHSAVEIVLNSQNTIYVSSVTFWEISLKIALGKLSIENYTPLELLKIAEESMKFILITFISCRSSNFLSTTRSSA